MFTRKLKKAWYEVPRIVINNDKPEVTIDIVETWFPERWEKKNSKLKFIKKNEVTYKMSIPEAELIKYAAEHSFIKEEIKND